MSVQGASPAGGTTAMRRALDISSFRFFQHRGVIARLSIGKNGARGATTNDRASTAAFMPSPLA